MNSFAHHLDHPAVPLEKHMRARQIELAGELPPKAIYLDTKFWLIGRDVVRHVRTNSEDVQLVESLEELVAAGRIFCPISEPVFLEVMKQEDRSTRRATAELIDRWSHGVSLIHSQRRMATELALLFREADQAVRVSAMHRLVWTRLSFVMGEWFPSGMPFDPITELAIQKAFFDRMWDLPLVVMVDRLAEASGADLDVDRQELADTINEGIAAWAHTINGFPSAFSEEARGVADLMQDIGVEILRDMAVRKKVRPLPGDRPQDVREVRALIAGLLQQPFTQMKLRTAYIIAAIHAAVRANKGRRFKTNDFLDFDHAAAALGYCDAFFTDAALGKLLTREPLQFDQRFNCPVAWTSEGAIRVLTQMPPSPTA
jgi:hypothetical protein